MSVKNLTFVYNSAPKCDADYLNDVRAEINNAVTASGQTLDDANNQQTSITHAIAASRGDYYQEAGGSAADVYVLEVVGAQEKIVNLQDGMRFRFKVVNANTGASTINVASTGVKSIYRNGVPLVSGDLLVNTIVTIIYNSTSDLYSLFTDEIAYPKGYFSRRLLDIANGSDSDHDIDLNFVSCRGKNNLYNIDLTSIITKQIDANWAEGTNSGGFPSGLTLSANTLYHFFVIIKNDGTIDAGWDTSDTASNLLSDATNYVDYHHIWWTYTDGSSNIIPSVYQNGHTTYDNEIFDASGAGAVAKAPLTASVPPNCRGYFRIGGTANGAGGTIINVYDKNVTNSFISAGSNNGFNYVSNGQLFVDSNSQVDYEVVGASISHALVTRGFDDIEI